MHTRKQCTCNVRLVRSQKLHIGMTEHESTSKYVVRERHRFCHYSLQWQTLWFMLSARVFTEFRAIKTSVPECFCVPCYVIEKLTHIQKCELVVMSQVSVLCTHLKKLLFFCRNSIRFCFPWLYKYLLLIFCKW
jgi:hypothetical protein